MLLLITMMSSFGLLASDIYLSSVENLSKFFGVDSSKITLTISVYLVALAISQLIYSFLIHQYGAKKTLTYGILVYLLSTLACIFCTDIDLFLLLRIFQGFGAASGLVIGRFLINQHYTRTQIPHIYAIVYPCVSLSPALAPLIGGYLTTLLNWQADFGFIALFAFVTLILCLLYLPQDQAKHVVLETFFTQIKTVFSCATFRKNTYLVCLIYQAWFIYLTQSAFIFRQLQLSPHVISYLYIPLTMGIIIANVFTKHALKRISSSTIKWLGQVSFLVGSILFLVCCLWSTQFWFLIISMFFVSLANGSTLSLAIADATSAPHQQPAIASSLVGFFQIATAGLSSYFISHFLGTY